MKYNIIGTIKLGRESRTFKKGIEAKGEFDATEKIYKFFGSKHQKLKRTQIKIDKVEKV
ncbi:50S ribosomal protein L18a [Candidatus Micrarchaeota archaeon]|jgi:ribosomal protein L20A (L18A)|nr:50S ribosomal protein L18a [Candidatus Micrarchaeota archaeon]